MAGIKLGWVVFTLLVPVAVLGYLINADIQSRLETTRHEIAGAKLMALVVPVFQASIAGENADDAIAGLQHDGARLVEQLELENEYKPVAQAFKADTGDNSAQVAALKDFLNAMYQKSAMMGEPDAETSNLGSLAMLDAPAIQESFRDIQNEATAQEIAKDASPAKSLQQFESVGQLQVSLGATMDHVTKAMAGSSDQAAYAEMKTQVLAASGQVALVHEALRHAIIANGIASPIESAQPKLFATAMNRAWNLSVTQLQMALGQREDIISRKSIAMIGLSVASILVGLGSALRMFRSSLVRLDDLESSKIAAETARNDAEDMNARLTMINNEIVTLNTELADKMRRLKEAQDELLRKGRMEQLGQLTATVAHELRNPLGAVRTSAFLLERKLKDKGLGVESQLTRINNGITRCDSIITQLLDFSRTKQVAATPADLDGWLATTIEEEARRVPASVTIDCTLGLDARQVPFDPARLQRAVINLISNAAEAMVGTGDDPTKFAVQNPVIRVATRAEPDMAVLEVSDNGPGIPAEIVEKIREPLFTTKSFGTGLGIPAVEQIVVQHGGRLDIDSQPGQGARFSIYLPFKIPQSEAA